MCVVSMIGDHYHDKWKDCSWQQPVLPDIPSVPIHVPVPVPVPSKDEFDKLKREVEEMKELLKRAKRYDEENGEPDCEIEEKMDFLRKVAELVGVDLNEVIGSGGG